MTPQLPDGVLVGHWTDREGWTGCTVVLLPAGSVASCEVRGGAPGTRETDGLSPAAADAGANAILLTGGSSFGLGAADGVVRWLAEQGRGHPMPAGPVPVVAAAVVYDLRLGSATVWPKSDEGYAACEAATATPEHGSVGAGTGCTVGSSCAMAGRRAALEWRPWNWAAVASSPRSLPSTRWARCSTTMARFSQASGGMTDMCARPRFSASRVCEGGPARGDDARLRAHRCAADEPRPGFARVRRTPVWPALSHPSGHRSTATRCSARRRTRWKPIRPLCRRSRPR